MQDQYASSLIRNQDSLTKLFAGYMFNDKGPNEKTMPKARALFYLIQEQTLN